MPGDLSDAPAIGRLKTRSEFLKARSGPSERKKTLVVQAYHRGGDVFRMGFTATKKIGTAPVRNRAKRRLREAARAVLPLEGVPGTDYVFIARQTTATADWDRLLDDMKSALISLAPRLASKTGRTASTTRES